MTRKVHEMLIRDNKHLWGWEGERVEEAKKTLGGTQHWYVFISMASELFQYTMPSYIFEWYQKASWWECAIF